MFILKDDKDDSKIREFIQETQAVTEQFNKIFIRFVPMADVSNFRDLKVAFIASNTLTRSLNLKKLPDLDYNNLIGETVWDYENRVVHAKRLKHLLDFVLERQIPPDTTCENIEGVFYLGKNENKYKNKILN